MRWCWPLVLVACKVSYPPSATLYVNARAVDKPVTASPGSRIQLSTAWEKTCERSAPLFVGSYEGGGGDSYTCDQVHHRVRIRCDGPCKITMPDGRTTTDAAVWGPTAFAATFAVEAHANALSLEVAFEHDGDHRIERMPAIRIATPHDLVVECGRDAMWRPCDLVASSDTQDSVRVRSEISLGAVMIAGSAAAYGYAPISRVVPVHDGQLVQGEYPLIVEVGHGTSALRRELVVRVR